MVGFFALSSLKCKYLSNIKKVIKENLGESQVKIRFLGIFRTK